MRKLFINMLIHLKLLAWKPGFVYVPQNGLIPKRYRARRHRISRVVEIQDISFVNYYIVDPQINWIPLYSGGNYLFVTT